MSLRKELVKEHMNYVRNSKLCDKAFRRLKKKRVYCIDEMALVYLSDVEKELKNEEEY